MSTALITSGNIGLGTAFASRLAADGHDLVLVGRDKDELDEIAGRLRTAHGVHVEILPADLAVAAERALVEQRLADASAPVDMLVNSAGLMVKDLFDEASFDALQEEHEVNVTSVLRLTRAALPGMIERGRGSVINVASFAGYLSPAGWAHAAGKAWVLSFTDNVAASLQGTGVRAIALALGTVRTGNHQGSSRMLLDPDAVVDRCLADLARGRQLSVPGAVYRTVVETLELPRRGLRGLSRLTRRNRERGVVRGDAKATIALR